jgi:hypothetical protein
MNDILQQLIDEFMPFAQEHIGFEYPPKLFFKQDQENADNPLGKTAFYDPAAKSVTLYITGRHPKDILRSLGHELVHHKQNCGGEFEGAGDMGPGYAQRDPHLRDMEEKANLHGSMCLRDFEDLLKKENTIYYEHLQKGEKTMSIKDWKNKEISTLLSEAWGFKFNTLQEFDEFNGTGEVQEEAQEDVDENRRPRLSTDSGENSPTQHTRATRKVSGPVPPAPEEEELEEGCGDDENDIQELLDPEAEEAPERVKRLSDAETAREKKNDSDMVKEEDGNQIEEILKKVISIVREQKMKGKSKN